MLKKRRKQSFLHVETKNYKEAVLYSESSFSAWWMQIGEARVCMTEAHGVRGSLPLLQSK